jgi:hypothetical protein
MATLLGIGALLIIGLAVGLILTFVALFFGNIILLDSIALSILTVVFSYAFWGVHLALSIVIGVAVGVGLFFLQKTGAGFWIIGGALSLLWAYLFSKIAYWTSGGDMVWTYAVFGVSAFMMIWLHHRARRRMT